MGSCCSKQQERAAQEDSDFDYSQGIIINYENHDDWSKYPFLPKEIALDKVSRDGTALRFLSEELKNDKDVVLAACSQNAAAINYASIEFRHDKGSMIAACSQNGMVLANARDELKKDKEVTLAACSQNGYALQFATDELKNDKDVVLAAYFQDTRSLQFASEEIKEDRRGFAQCVNKKLDEGHPHQTKTSINQTRFHDEKISLSAGEAKKSVLLDQLRMLDKNIPLALGPEYYHIPDASQKKPIVLAAVSHDGNLLEYASGELKNDKEVVLAACSQCGLALEFASEQLKDDKEVVLKACSQKGRALSLAPERHRSDKEVVLTACSQNGFALKFASESLRTDKEVVMNAAASKPESLKFALGELNQDKECLIASGLWDRDYSDRNETSSINDSLTKCSMKKIVLSTKFSLSARSSAHATMFAVELKKNPYISAGNFIVYSPNAFDKGTCDPKWTDKNWPCRGTYDSCLMPPHLKRGVPQEHKCCWRYSFRYQLEEAHCLGGFMIQVIDWDYKWSDHTLGDGQKIESEMASDVGIKTFRFFQTKYSFGDAYAKEVEELVSKIQEWYNGGCSDMEVCYVLGTVKKE